MPTSTEIYLQLKAPFPVSRLHWRVGATNKNKTPNGKATKGIALAYIDARDVMKRLDDVVGPWGWQSHYSHVTPQGVVCNLGLRIDNEWLWRANGAGETDIEAEKGAMSDAFKRAAVMFGVGRYLYYLPNKWVDLDNYGHIHASPELPKWAIPEDE